MRTSHHQPSVVSSAVVVVWLAHFPRVKVSFLLDGVCCGDLAVVSALLAESATLCKFFLFSLRKAWNLAWEVEMALYNSFMH